jgi:hypothetical protein
MSFPLIDQLQEAFGGGGLTPEKLQSLIQETLKVFQLLQTKINSNDPKEKEEALGMALQLKQALEAQAENLCKSVGMNPSQLAEFVSNPENFSKDEWDTLGIARKELDVLKDALDVKGNESKLLRVKKKNPKTWLAG